MYHTEHSSAPDLHAPLGTCAICGCAAWTTSNDGLLCPDHANVLREFEDDDRGDLSTACVVAIICGNCGEYGHRTLDCPRPPQPRPGHVALPDAHELAAELSAKEGLDLTEALPLARSHLAHLTLDPPAEPEPKPIPGPRPLPPIDPMPRGGRYPIVAEALLAEADTLLDEPTIFQTLRRAHTEIVALRSIGLHTSAATARDNALRKVEAYLDPEADLIRQEQLAAARTQVRMLLAERVEIDGVDIPF